MEHVQPSQRYSYQPLTSEREIRLIQLAPDDTQSHGFSLKLEAVGLDDAPPYCALSYTWNSPIVTHPSRHGDKVDDPDETPVMVDIQCDGNSLTVSENALNFFSYAFRNRFFLASGSDENDPPSLLHLSLDDAQVVPKYVWVDAISINQSDIDERSHQVSLMGDIYQACATTIVWLGEDDPHPEVQWVLQAFIPQFLDFYDSRGYKYLMGLDPALLDAALVEHFGEEISSRWNQASKHFLLFLVQRRWFYRGWVVQEAVLSGIQAQEPADAAVVCGCCTTPLSNLTRFVQAFTRTDWRRTLMERLRSDASLNVDGLSRLISPAFQRINILRTFEKRLGDPSSQFLFRMFKPMTARETAHTVFYNTLFHMRRFYFTDKRDFVYGCLGLVSSCMAEESGISALTVVPDYHLSVAEVYIEAAWAILKNMPCLDLLGTAGGFSDNNSHSLPSWVPDFSLAPKMTRFSTIQSTFQARRGFDSSKTRSPVSMFLRVDKTKLVLQGLKLCTVAQEGPRLDNFSGFQLDFEWFLEHSSQYDVSARYPGTKVSFDEALCRTLVANTFRHDSKESENAPAFRAWWSKGLAQRIREHEGKLPGSSAYLMDLVDRAGSVSDWLPSLSEVVDAIQNGRGNTIASSIDTITHRLWTARVFFVTDDGRFGLGSRDVASGDEVWLLKGGRSPLMLRPIPDGSGYRNVGEAYVHGVMYGEAATDEVLSRMRSVVIC